MFSKVQYAVEYFKAYIQYFMNRKSNIFIPCINSTIFHDLCPHFIYSAHALISIESGMCQLEVLSLVISGDLRGHLIVLRSRSSQMFQYRYVPMHSLIQNHTLCPCPQDIHSSGSATSSELPFSATGLARRIIITTSSRFPPQQKEPHLPAVAA